MILYNISLFFFKIGIHLAAFFNKKARQWIAGRKNIFQEIERKLAEKNVAEAQIIWMHCASLGEFEQGRPVLESFKNKNVKTVLTFFSPSGYEIRKNDTVADFIFYLPFDTPKNAKRFIELIKPVKVFFIKYDFWGNYLQTLKNNNIPTFLIAAQFRTIQFTSLYGIYLRKILPCFTHFFAQTIETEKILKQHGFTNVTVTGDTRVDRVLKIKSENKTLPLIERFTQSKKTFIAGSTWQEDERVITPLIPENNFSDWQYIIVPHDVSPERIQSLQKTFGISAITYSELEKLSPTTTLPRVLIIDRIGLLSSMYRYGTVAYIGGGFGSGIHNTLEPAVFGLPIIFGTKYKKFPEARNLVLNGGAFSIADTLQLQNCLSNLNDERVYEKTRTVVSKFIDGNKGATEIIRAYFQQKSFNE